MRKNKDVRRTELEEENKRLHDEILSLRHDVAAAEKAHDTLAGAVNDTRKNMEDLRRQRDLSQSREKEMQALLRYAEADLQRALGWIDAKMEKEPQMGALQYRELPF